MCSIRPARVLITIMSVSSEPLQLTGNLADVSCPCGQSIAMVHPNAHLKTLVRSELIVECRLHQLKSTGSRDELLSRLLAHMSYPTDDVVDTASPGSVSSPHLYQSPSPSQVNCENKIKNLRSKL